MAPPLYTSLEEVDFGIFSNGISVEESRVCPSPFVEMYDVVVLIIYTPLPALF